MARSDSREKLVSLGKREAGPGTLEVQPFGDGIRLRFNGRTGFYFDAGGSFGGTGNIVNPEWTSPQ